MFACKTKIVSKLAALGFASASSFTIANAAEPSLFNMSAGGIPYLARVATNTLSLGPWEEPSGRAALVFQDLADGNFDVVVDEVCYNDGEVARLFREAQIKNEPGVENEVFSVEEWKKKLARTFEPQVVSTTCITIKAVDTSALSASLGGLFDQHGNPIELPVKRRVDPYNQFGRPDAPLGYDSVPDGNGGLALVPNAQMPIFITKPPPDPYNEFGRPDAPMGYDYIPDGKDGLRLVRNGQMIDEAQELPKDPYNVFGRPDAPMGYDFVPDGNGNLVFVRNGQETAESGIPQRWNLDDLPSSRAMGSSIREYELNMMAKKERAEATATKFIADHYGIEQAAITVTMTAGYGALRFAQLATIATMTRFAQLGRINQALAVSGGRDSLRQISFLEAVLTKTFEPVTNTKDRAQKRAAASEAEAVAAEKERDDYRAQQTARQADIDVNTPYSPPGSETWRWDGIDGNSYQVPAEHKVQGVNDWVDSTA